MATNPEQCQVSDVVADSGWEHKVAERLEEMAEVHAYVKNESRVRDPLHAPRARRVHARLHRRSTTATAKTTSST